MTKKCFGDNIKISTRRLSMEKDLEKIRAALNGLNKKMVSNISGVHYNTILKICRGNANVSLATITKLKGYLEIND